MAGRFPGGFSRLSIVNRASGYSQRRKIKKPLNIVGPQVRKFRDRKGWTQEVLAEKLQLQGWDIFGSSVAKLEARLRWASDCELLFLARALGVSLPGLYPPNLDLKKVGPQFR